MNTVPTHYFYLEEPITNHSAHIEALWDHIEEQEQRKVQAMYVGIDIRAFH